MSEAVNIYDPGDVVRITGTFTDQAGTAIDPSSLTFKVSNPAGQVTTYTYGTDAQLVKDSTGNYHVDVDADQGGKYRWRWASTGTGKAADEGAFSVRRSKFQA